MNSIIAFIVVLGLLIFVHEFGHFLFAKLFRVKVLKFSLGFGPKLIGRRYGETEYLISALPLGGYVKMLGEQPGEELGAEDMARSFSHKPVWQRFLIVAGGPTFNLLFALFIFFMIFATAGLPELKETTQIGQVGPDTPAMRAGLRQDDIIREINGQTITRWEEISQLISGSNGAPVVLSISRGEEALEFTIRPEKKSTTNIFGETVGENYQIGIVRSQEMFYRKASIGEAFIAGSNQTWFYTELTVMGLVKIIQRVVPASEIGGPILIAQIAGQKLKDGWLDLFFFTALISVNLGILNFFPIPVLDGGHLVFFLIEAVRRKPLHPRIQEITQQIGLVLLISLMIFVFYNDLFRQSIK